MFKKVLSGAALLTLGLSSVAFAGTNTTQLQVSATVATSCAFSTNNSGPSAAYNGFNFGDITNLVGQTANATAALTYVCNTQHTPQIALSDVNGSSTIGFQLKNTTSAAQNLLPFTIVQTGLTTPFTDSNVAFQAANSNPISLTASIAVPATLPAGAYTDVVTATLLP